MLRIGLLGSPTFERDGNPVAADTRKASALLAYLAVEGPTRRDTLAALFWPESPDSQARATLRRTLSALRSAMGAEVISSDRQQVRITDQVSHDVAEFGALLDATSGHDHGDADVCPRCVEPLSAAVDIYRGDFLEGFSLRDTPDFDDWVRTTAEAFRLACENAYERLITALAAEGDFRSAIEAATAWIDLDPLREPAYRELMLLYAWSGDRIGATETYRRCIATLSEELGVEPLEETTELLEAILDDDLPPAPGARRRLQSKPPVPTRRPPDLIDRDEQLSALLSAVSEFEAGQVIRLHGDTWMGKTRLLDEMLDFAKRGRRVTLSARGYRAERQLPLGVVSQLLNALVADPRWEDLLTGLPPWALAEAARIHPGLATASETTDAFGETRLYDALVQVFGSKPTLMIVDDSQWVDPSSGAFLAYLTHRIARTETLLVIAHRPDSSGPLATLIEAIAAAPSTEIALHPLAVADLTEVAPDEELAKRLVQRTGGIPALVSEALAGSDDDGRLPGVRRFMEARLAELGDLEQQVLSAAAVLDGMCDLDLLRDTSGRSDEEVAAAVEVLVARRILTTRSGAEIGFILDSLEDLIYEETNVIRRRLLHRRAADALGSRRRADTEPSVAASVARHYREGGDAGSAADWYLRAGDMARTVFASTEAIDAYRNAIALDTPEEVRAHLALGEALLFDGHFSEALLEFESAGDSDDDETKALAEHRAGEALRRLGRIDGAIARFRSAQRHHPDPVQLHTDWALAELRAGHQKAAREQADRAVVASEKGSDAERSRALAVLGMVSKHRAESRSALEEALELAGDDPILRMAALNALGYSYAVAGDDELAQERLEQALSIAQAIGDRHREAALWNHLADLHHRAGRTSDAEQSLTEAVKLFVEVEPGSWEPEVWLLSQW